MQRGSKEHILARAEYFKGLVTKTTDPVHWNQEDILAAEAALTKAAEDVLYRRQYIDALAMIESAKHKASYEMSR